MRPYCWKIVSCTEFGNKNICSLCVIWRLVLGARSVRGTENDKNKFAENETHLRQCLFGGRANDKFSFQRFYSLTSDGGVTKCDNNWLSWHSPKVSTFLWEDCDIFNSFNFFVFNVSKRKLKSVGIAHFYRLLRFKGVQFDYDLS